MASPNAHLTLVSSGQIPEPPPRLRSADRLTELFSPLDMLLCRGGDDRLTIAPSTRFNSYGCSPRPRPRAITFASSTATSISERAYRHAHRAKERLIEDAATKGLFEAFETHIEHTRSSLRAYLGLEAFDAEIVFSPSGTDSQLHALFFSQLVLGGPLTSLIVGSDQTGSGTAFTARGRHFSGRTAQGKAVLKGSGISGWSEEPGMLEVPFVSANGTIRSEAEMDELVFAAVEREIRKGRNVVLQAMNASKFGWRAPTDACLAAISETWPRSVRIVIDACQMRTGRARIASYLERGYFVLLTGSKFFTGPPFSGALLLPRCTSDRLALLGRFPGGLFDYADRSDLPEMWSGARCDFDLQPNFGQWLRWEAALLEMRDYFALPALYRRSVVAGVSTSVGRLMASFEHVELYPPYRVTSDFDDEEFSEPTIFPFLVKRGGAYLGFAEVTDLYRALNRDLSGGSGSLNSGDETSVSSRLCHIGQPVKVMLPGGEAAAALRISLGSRTLFESWSPGSGAAERAIQSIMAGMSAVLEKIDFCLRVDRHQILSPSGARSLADA